jgi:hypothetical protein
MSQRRGLLLLLPLVLAACGDSTFASNDAGGGGGSAGGDATIAPADAAPAGADVTLNWGSGVTVALRSTSWPSTGLTMRVTDRAAMPSLSLTRDYPPANRVRPADGANLGAHFTCSDPGLYEVDIQTCSREFADRETTTLGCATVWFDWHGTVGGKLLHPTGATCTVTGGQAAITFPRPDWSVIATNATRPLDVASGTFTAHCVGQDGTDVDLDGTFAIPVEPTVLLCQSDE